MRSLLPEQSWSKEGSAENANWGVAFLVLFLSESKNRAKKELSEWEKKNFDLDLFFLLFFRTGKIGLILFFFTENRKE